MEQFNVTGFDTSLFTEDGYPKIDISGNLTFTPALGASGVTTVTVTLQDNGGTDGRQDTSAPQTFNLWIVGVDVTVQPFIAWNNTEDYIDGAWDLDLQQYPSADTNLAPVTVTLTPAALAVGTMTVGSAAGSLIDLWDDAQKDSPAQLTWDAGSAAPSIYAEGIACSSSLYDVQLSAVYQIKTDYQGTIYIANPPGSGQTNVTQVTLTVDTMNNNDFNPVSSQPKDVAEKAANPLWPGKNIDVNNAIDQNGLPANVDLSSTNPLVPIVVTFPPFVDPHQAKINIIYSASDPNPLKMIQDNNGNWLPDPSGSLRLWDIDAVTGARTLADYIAPGVYNASDFFSTISSTGQQLVWYVEAAWLGSNTQTNLPITMQVDPTGQVDPSGYILTDTVYVNVIYADLTEDGDNATPVSNPGGGGGGGGNGDDSGPGINLVTGEFTFHGHDDIDAVNPIGPTARFKRCYHSSRVVHDNNYGSPGLSPGWMSCWDVTITPLGTGEVDFTYPSGGVDKWYANGSGGYASALAESYLLTESCGSFTVTWDGGETWIFSPMYVDSNENPVYVVNTITDKMLTSIGFLLGSQREAVRLDSRWTG